MAMFDRVASHTGGAFLGLKDRFRFSTPAGGVEFNRMSVWLQNTSGNLKRCSFGIYDTSGKAVAHSGEIIVNTDFEGIKDIPMTGKLRPSALYYTAWGANSGSGLSTQPIPIPPVPGFGVIPGVVTNGLIPNAFDPGTVVYVDTFQPIAIALRMENDR